MIWEKKRLASIVGGVTLQQGRQVKTTLIVTVSSLQTKQREYQTHRVKGTPCNLNGGI